LFETNRDGIGPVAVADGGAGLLNKGRAATFGSPHLWSVYGSLTCADNSNRGGSPHERADRNPAGSTPHTSQVKTSTASTELTGAFGRLSRILNAHNRIQQD